MAPRDLSLTVADTDEMVRLYGMGYSTIEIGRVFDCLGGSVWARLKKRGVKFRPIASQKRSWSATSHGYVRYGRQYLHRLVTSAWLGRELRDGEVIHHKDGDRTNNHPDNLEVVENNGIHCAMHVEIWSKRFVGQKARPARTVEVRRRSTPSRLTLKRRFGPVSTSAVTATASSR